MYEVLCERCWHTEALEGDVKPEHACSACGATGSWLGPFAQAPQRFGRRDSWPLLTSPFYSYAGRTDRRSNPR
jgi:hypothetical protein